MTKKISLKNAEHYKWGEMCDGWHLVKNDALSIILERVPAGKSEVRHYHNRSRQFFFILEGEGRIELDNETVKLSKNEGIEIPPETVHKFRNDSDKDVTFLVISSPKSNGDRVNCE